MDRVKDWIVKVNRVIEQQNREQDVASLRSSMLEMCQQAFNDGMNAAVSQSERRMMAATVYGAGQPEEGRVKAALEVAEMMIERTKV